MIDRSSTRPVMNISATIFSQKQKTHINTNHKYHRSNLLVIVQVNTISVGYEMALYSYFNVLVLELSYVHERDIFSPTPYECGY